MFYSRSTKGFYLRKIHGNNIPEDAIEITQEEYGALLSAQTSGKRIVPDESGRPVAVDPPAQSPEDAARATLAALDPLLPRCVEDIVDVAEIEESDLPEIMRERLSAKRAARAIIRGE